MNVSQLKTKMDREFKKAKDANELAVELL